MKRLCLILSVILVTVLAQAKPARPGVIRYRQPDGSTLELLLHGDAFGHYATDPSGQVMARDANGFYRYSALPEAAIRRRLQTSRPQVQPRALPSQGNPHFLVVLIEFADVHFSVEDPQAYFHAMLNQEGFSDYGGTGSLQDYYRDNSLGVLVPQFDVVGPVRLNGKMADYGKDILVGGERERDAAPQRALYEACLQLDQELDFSQYDADADGETDLVIYYYAGYDQAEGASSDAIWTHFWHMDAAEEPEVRDALFDDVKLGTYICASELMGNEGSAIQGIGTLCHEFAHALGLPDLYDTDGAAQGLAGALYQFSLMCDGLYNNDSRTPPYLNALERCLLGWMEEDAIPELPEGKLFLRPVQENQAYRSPTGTEGEYYLYECRNGSGWDAPLPAGLAVYHVDRSQRRLHAMPILDLWDNWMEYNNLNNVLAHPCFYLIPANDPGSRNTPSAINPGSMLFPGTGDVHCYEAKGWDGAYTGVQLTDICFDGEASRLRVFFRGDASVSGQVLDINGAPLSLVTIAREGDLEDWVFTDSEGFFLLPLAQTDLTQTTYLNISKPGHRSQRVCVSPKYGRTAYLTVVLPALEDPTTVRLALYDASSTSGYFPTEGPVLCGVRFEPEELTPFIGMRLSQVQCHPLIYYPEYVGQMYVTVDFGKQRVLNFPVKDPPLGEFNCISVDITKADIRIPEGLPVYVGYGFDQIEFNAPAGTVYPGTRGSSWWSPFSLEHSDWKEMYAERYNLYMDLMLSAQVDDVPAEEMSAMGFNAINPGKGSYRAGETFPLQLILSSPPKSVSWQLDGKTVTTDAVQLMAGEHRIKARLDFGDNRTETLELVLEVED